VTTVNDFEEGNLSITCKIDILCAISDKLHKTSGHDRRLNCLYYIKRKYFFHFYFSNFFIF
jgi:hypothetical protein